MGVSTADTDLLLQVFLVFAEKAVSWNPPTMADVNSSEDSKHLSIVIAL